MSNTLISKDTFYHWANRFILSDVEENIVKISNSWTLSNPNSQALSDVASDVKTILFEYHINNTKPFQLGAPPEQVSTIVFSPYCTESFTNGESEVFSEYFNNSLLSRLPRNVSKLGIRSISLNYKFLENIPNFVRVLDLQNNINFLAKYNTPVTISANLEALGLSSCFLLRNYSILPTDTIVEFLSSLHNATNLSKLDLSNNELERHSDEDFARIMNAIPHSVTHLRLSGNSILQLQLQLQLQNLLPNNVIFNNPQRLASIPTHIQFLDLSDTHYNISLSLDDLKLILRSLPQHLTVKFAKNVEINLAADNSYLFEDVFEKINVLEAYGNELISQPNRRQAGLDAVDLSLRLKQKFEELAVKKFFKQNSRELQAEIKELLHESRAILGDQRKWEDYILPIFLICIGIGLFILPINKLMTGQFFLNSTHRQNQLYEIENRAARSLN